MLMRVSWSHSPSSVIWFGEVESVSAGWYRRSSSESSWSTWSFWSVIESGLGVLCGSVVAGSSVVRGRLGSMGHVAV